MPIHVQTRVLRYSLVIFLLSSLSIQNCVWSYCTSKTGRRATSCFASKGKCFADYYWTSGIIKTIKFNWQSHSLPQMLKLPLPQLHLKQDAPSIFRWITGIWWSSLTGKLNCIPTWETQPSQPHLCLLLPPSSKGRKKQLTTNPREDTNGSCRYTDSMMVPSHTIFNTINIHVIPTWYQVRKRNPWLHFSQCSNTSSYIDEEVPPISFW